MKRLSTSWTLMFRVFLPTLWLSFFIPFTIYLLFFDHSNAILHWGFSSILFFVLLSGVLIYFLSLSKLRRVDVDDDFFYVSNYFKTVKFPYEMVEKIDETNIVAFRLFSLTLKKKGQLGKKIKFLESGKIFRDLISENPDRFEHLLSK